MVASAAPSQDHVYPLWPCAVVHGEKWSEHMAISKPDCSALWTSASSWRGSICSCEAWKPKRVIASANRRRRCATTPQSVLVKLVRWLRCLPQTWCRDELFLFVSVDASTTRTAATRIATIHRVQSIPRLPSPPNAE